MGAQQKEGDDEEPSESEIYYRNVQRARAVMLGSHHPEKALRIYGLLIVRANSNTSLYDIYSPTEDEDEGPHYLDTIDVDKFISARGLVDQVLNYYPNEEAAEEADEEDDELDDLEPSPGFH